MMQHRNINSNIFKYKFINSIEIFNHSTSTINLNETSSEFNEINSTKKSFKHPKIVATCYCARRYEKTKPRLRFNLIVVRLKQIFFYLELATIFSTPIF